MRQLKLWKALRQASGVLQIVFFREIWMYVTQGFNCSIVYVTTLNAFDKEGAHGPLHWICEAPVSGLEAHWRKRVPQRDCRLPF